MSVFIFQPYIMESFWCILVFHSMHEVEFGLFLQEVVGEDVKVVEKRIGSLFIFGVSNGSNCFFLQF